VNVRQLRNNGELFEFLTWLNGQLRSRGEVTLADGVVQASRFISGSASEFLHEAHSILTKVAGTAPSVLTPAELGDVRNVLQQIDTAFKNVGGA
jgi:hypothetical protein